MVVSDDKSNALFLNDGKHSIIVGSLGANFSYNKSDKPFSGYVVLDKDKKVTHQLNLSDESGKMNK